MIGNGFVPPKVVTPQKYFMMNVPLVDSVTNQTKPHQIKNKTFDQDIKRQVKENIKPR